MAYSGNLIDIDNQQSVITTTDDMNNTSPMVSLLVNSNHISTRHFKMFEFLGTRTR
jgi:hypothetical protein